MFVPLRTVLVGSLRRWAGPGAMRPGAVPLGRTRRSRRLVSGLAGLGLAVGLQAADNFSSVYISEFMADNQRGLRDEEGDRSGWIELHNGSASTVNLNGWCLSDRTNEPAKWRFPGVFLLPDKDLVVFASGKGRTNDLARLHTNFRLDKQGGYLALLDPAKRVISEFAPGYPPQTADLSYGRL